ncbi:MAG: hypothetical protein E7010_02695 [Alphaproteobacteria bacterium]|nr:hypothetical protein [Alphaproteobacteria bacterium]
MSEMVKNFAMLLWIACAINNGSSSAHAQGIQEESKMQSDTIPTIVFGKSERSDGEIDEVVVEQSNNNINPLGDPLPEVVTDSKQTESLLTKNNSELSTTSKPDKMSLSKDVDVTDNLGKQFQNTLMEANGRVYDVQSFPVEDMNAIGNSSNPETIYSPNVNP